MQGLNVFIKRRALVGLVLILVLISACTALPTPLGPAAPTGSPIPTPTATARPPTPTASPTPPSAADLQTLVEAGLMPTPTPDISGWSPSGIAQVVVLPLESPPGDRPLWAVASTGGRYFEAEQYHFVALYTHDAAGWQELARLELVPDFKAEPVDPGADYLFEGSVSQVSVTPGRIWLQVEGGTGAHSGTYHLLSFDGQALRVELAAFSSSPGVARVADLNDDGLGEVVLDASDPYVFCYACGVRKIAYQVFAWDETAGRVSQVSLEALPAEQAPPLRDAVNEAVALAQAGLWKDAVEGMAQAEALLAQYPQADVSTVAWNDVLIRLHAEAMAKEVAQSQYPLLSTVFYGDYAAALDVMRPYGLQELFGPDSPLIVGSVAEGWESALSDWLVRGTTQALTAQPDLAAAYFIRGWATYLVSPYDPEVVANLERAIELAPDEPLFSQVALENLKDKTLTEFELELLAGDYDVEVRRFDQGEVSYRASFYTHTDWFANPNYLLIAKTEGQQTEIVYQLQEARRFLLYTYSSEGQTTLDWVDMNADGLMELPFIVDQGGNCWTCSQMQVLQLRADDSVVSLTDSVPSEDELGESFVALGLNDADGDGVQEWLVLDARFEFAFDLCHACSPAGFRLYAWDGEVYHNASAQFPEFYAQRIADLSAQVEEMRQSDEPWTGTELGNMVSLLLAYENAGRGEEGLALFDEYSEPTQYEGRLSEEQLTSLQEARDFFLTPPGQ